MLLVLYVNVVAISWVIEVIHVLPKDLQQPLRPDFLIVLDLLSPRMSLCEELLLKHKQLRRGYDGEMYFFKRLKERLSSSMFIINNLILQLNDSEVQIDSLVIVGKDVYLFEVKNYSGDYIVEGERWYSVRTGNEIRNPLLQLNRTRYLFQKIMEQQQLYFKLYPYLIFVNEEFTLYMPEPNKEVILPTQLNRFLTHLSKQPSTDEAVHKKLIDYFIATRYKQSKYTSLPHYKFAQLRKGITCESCHRFLVRYHKNKFKCNHCGKLMEFNKSVLRMINDFQILFPLKKLTVTIIYEWCGRMITKNPIARILNENYEKVGKGKGTYYISK